MADAPSDTGDKPEFVTKDELAQIVNSAVTSQLKRSLGKSLSEAIEAAVAPLREQLTQAPAAPAAKPDKADKAEPHPLEAELAKLNAKLEKSESARKATERRSHEEKAYTALVAELSSSGKLRQEAIPLAADLLFRARGAVRVDDDGAAVYLHDQQELPLGEGVAAWCKSKEASLFMAPPAGAKPPANKPSFLPAPRPGAQGTDKPQGSPEERAAARLAERGIDLKSVLG